MRTISCSYTEIWDSILVNLNNNLYINQRNIVYKTKGSITYEMEEIHNNNSYTMNGTTLSPTSSTVGAENLYPALIECFGIIALGYLAGR